MNKKKNNNPVAKYARINKASVHRDKTKYYRKEKHKKPLYTKEAFLFIKDQKSKSLNAA